MKNLVKEFAEIIGLDVSENGTVVIDGHSRDLFEMMKDLHAILSEYSDTDEESSVFTIEHFHLNKQPNSEFGKKVDRYLNGIDFSIKEQPISEADILREIEQKIKESCIASRYNNLCMRVQTEGGMAYVVNRCITMMSKDKIHLSAALASLESEEEGIN